MSADVQCCGTARRCARCERIAATDLKPPSGSVRLRRRCFLRRRKILLSGVLVLLGLSGITACSRHASAPEEVQLNTALHREASKEWNFIVVVDFQWRLQGYAEGGDKGIVIAVFYSFTVKNRYAKESFELRFQLRLLDAEGVEVPRHEVLVEPLSGTTVRLVSGSFEFGADGLERAGRSVRMLVELQ